MMKNNQKVLFTIPLMALVLAGCGGAGGGGGNNRPDLDGPGGNIVVDGGGDIANFNTTASMKQSSANPYPYNTLETLCREWEELHPGWTVTVNKTSSQGDRSVILPQLQTHTAPHIMYQNGSVISSDLGQDYYVPLNKYLDSPDPYLEGNAAWKTVYNEAELAGSVASDGEHYYCNLEKIPVAFVYNKTLLNAAGIAHPENISTFSQFIAALEALRVFYSSHSEYAGYGKYATEYTWYQIALECNLFSDMVELGDVLRKNGVCDTEEICRLYTKGLYNPLQGINSKSDMAQNNFEGNRLYEYIKIIERLDQYKEGVNFAARQRWIAGQLGFMEVTGNLLRTLNAIDVDYEWGTICFPDLTTADSVHATKGCVRGTAGLATAWWISNRAMDDGSADMCADLLMYLTAPAQNNRLIGDLKGGIPLNPGSDYQLEDYLKPLVAKYDEDLVALSNGQRVSWASFNTWGNLGTSYNTAFIRQMQELDAHISDSSKGATAEQSTATLAYTIKNTVQAFNIEYDYDQSKW